MVIPWVPTRGGGHTLPSLAPLPPFPLYLLPTLPLLPFPPFSKPRELASSQGPEWRNRRWGRREVSGDDSVQGTDESAGPGAARGQAGVEERREHTCGAPVAMETPPP